MQTRSPSASGRCLVFVAVALALPLGVRAESLSITNVEATPLFPKANAGEPQRQIVRLSLKNSGGATEARVKIAVTGSQAYEQSLGSLASGTSTKEIRVAEISRPTELTVELFARTRGNRPT